MRGLILALLLGGVACNGQTKGTLACAVRLELPGYPSLARTAHVEGLVSVSFTVGKDGSPTEIAIVVPHEGLRSVVESRVAKSKFKPDCVGARLMLRVKFTLRPPRQKLGGTEVALVAPDTVEVTTTLPEKSETQPASSAQ